MPPSRCFLSGNNHSHHVRFILNIRKESKSTSSCQAPYIKFLSQVSCSIVRMLLINILFPALPPPPFLFARRNANIFKFISLFNDTVPLFRLVYSFFSSSPRLALNMHILYTCTCVIMTSAHKS